MRSCPLIALAAACVVATAITARTQSPAGSGVIAGVLISDDGANTPIRRARVSLASADGKIGGTVVTESDGRFTFANLPAGQYTIEATKPAHLKAAYGAKRPGRSGLPVSLATGGRMTDVTLRMARGAVVTGSVRLETGQPAAGATVAVLYPQVVGDVEVLTPRTTPSSTTTDETGAYRVYGLMPGTAVVVATARARINDGETADYREMRTGDAARALQTGAAAAAAASVNVDRGPLVALAPTYYPSATDVGGATRITLAAGEERTAIDLTMPLVTTARVTGTIRGPDGTPLPSSQITVAGGAQVGTFGGAIGGITSVASDAQGRYRIPSLTPGTYMLLALARAPGTSGLWAMSEFTLAGRDLDLPLTLQPGMTISGRVVVDSASATPDLAGVELRLVTTGAMPILANTSPVSGNGGTFSLSRVMPGRYRVALTAASAKKWFTISSIVRGQDTLDTPYEVRGGENVSDWVVTITDRPSELSGALIDEAGRPAPGYWILVYARDRAFWTNGSRRIVQMRAGVDGRFSFAGLPAGEYLIAALADLEPLESLPPAFLESLVAASVRVTMADGQRTVQDLRIGR